MSQMEIMIVLSFLGWLWSLKEQLCVKDLEQSLANMNAIKKNYGGYLFSSPLSPLLLKTSMWNLQTEDSLIPLCFLSVMPRALSPLPWQLVLGQINYALKLLQTVSQNTPPPLTCERCVFCPSNEGITKTLGMMVHTSNPGTQEAEATGLWGLRIFLGSTEGQWPSAEAESDKPMGMKTYIHTKLQMGRG